MAESYPSAELGAQTNQLRKDDYTRPLEEMNPREIVALVDKWFERVIDNRRHVERDSLLNIAFLLDQQYVSVSKVGKSARLTPMPAKKGQVRTTEQIIEQVVRREMSRLLQARPQGTVIPRGMDAKAHEAARAAEDVHAHIMRTHDLEEFHEDAGLWMICGGTSHIGVNWNPQEMDEFGVPGDFKFRVLSPFEFGVPQTRKQRLEDQSYVMVTKAYELEEIFQRWGVKVEPDRHTKFGALDDKLTSIVQAGSPHKEGGTGSTQDKKVPMAVVKECWIKPSPRAPAGAVAVVASGQLLELSTWPDWCNGEYPFSKQQYMRIPGSYWGKAMVTSLIPIQRRHNRAASIIIETMNIMARLTVAAPRNTQVRSVLGGKGVLFETPLGSPGGVSNITPPPMSDLPFRELDNTRQAARDISHQHEVSRGHTPPNVRSGTAIQSLKEFDDAAAVIPTRAIERSAQKIGRLVLNIVQKRWEEPRLILILGDEGDIERHSFVSGRDVGGFYTVVPGSAWPHSKAEQQALVWRALEAGLLDPNEGLQQIDNGFLKPIIKNRYRDHRHARRENQKFKTMEATNPSTGQPDMEYIQAQYMALLPQDWHNHMVHLEVHNNERKSPEYEQWPTWKRSLFEAHIMGHEAVLQTQLASMGQIPGGEEGEPQ